MGIAGIVRSSRGLLSRPSRGQSLVEFTLVFPILLILFLGIADLGRIYATLITVESAAREAADYGAYSSSNWISDATAPLNRAKTEAGMTERACIASNRLTDYTGSASTCSNPTVTITLTDRNGAVEPSNCDDPDRTPYPCRVRVDLGYRFTLFAPVGFDFLGVRFGLPPSLTFTRTSIFAMSDFDGVDKP